MQALHTLQSFKFLAVLCIRTGFFRTTGLTFSIHYIVLIFKKCCMNSINTRAYMYVRGTVFSKYNQSFLGSLHLNWKYLHTTEIWMKIIVSIDIKFCKNLSRILRLKGHGNETLFLSFFYSAPYRNLTRYMNASRILLWTPIDILKFQDSNKGTPRNIEHRLPFYEQNRESSNIEFPA
jgi:hypothetical protein